MELTIKRLHRECDHPEVIMRLAEELHRNHRAAEKAMRTAATGRGSLNVLLHDHGWNSCGKREYFIKRAKLIVARSGVKPATTIMQAEEQLAATILRRRILQQYK
jgi:hypothetical protein